LANFNSREVFAFAMIIYVYMSIFFARILELKDLYEACLLIVQIL